MTFALELGQRVKAARTAAAISQEALAARAGLHRNEISNIERGTGGRAAPVDPKVSTVYRIAGALEVSPAQLLPGVDEVPAEV